MARATREPRGHLCSAHRVESPSALRQALFVARSSTRPPSRRILAAAGVRRRRRREVRSGSTRGVLLSHPTRRAAAQRELPHRVVERLVSSFAPANGRALGLAVVWPRPDLERRLRQGAIALWEEEQRHAKTRIDGLEPLIRALRARADVLRGGASAHSLGASRLAWLLRAAADDLAAGGS